MTKTRSSSTTRPPAICPDPLAGQRLRAFSPPCRRRHQPIPAQRRKHPHQRREPYCSRSSKAPLRSMQRQALRDGLPICDLPSCDISPELCAHLIGGNGPKSSASGAGQESGLRREPGKPARIARSTPVMDRAFARITTVVSADALRSSRFRPSSFEARMLPTRGHRMSSRSRPDLHSDYRSPHPLQFPAQSHRQSSKPAKSSETHDEMMEAFANVSRRINDLARELKCLGYFDDNADRPRAA
jgi:hypothetical protein